MYLTFILIFSPYLYFSNINLSGNYTHTYKTSAISLISQFTSVIVYASSNFSLQNHSLPISHATTSTQLLTYTLNCYIMIHKKTCEHSKVDLRVIISLEEPVSIIVVVVVHIREGCLGLLPQVVPPFSYIDCYSAQLFIFCRENKKGTKGYIRMHNDI